VKDRQNEEQIRTRLRQLTEESRRAREELSELLRGRETPPSRRFLHQTSWPKSSPTVAAEKSSTKPRRKPGNGSSGR
jgi:hypothetical protein